jgi:hypothetical protein
MAFELHIDDVGVPFDVVLADGDDSIVDFASASAITFLFQNPDGDFFTRVASPVLIDGVPGARYYLEPSDLTVGGTWRAQVKLEFPGEVVYTPIFKFKVKVNLPLEF